MHTLEADDKAFLGGDVGRLFDVLVRPEPKVRHLRFVINRMDDAYGCAQDSRNRVLVNVLFKELAHTIAFLGTIRCIDEHVAVWFHVLGEWRDFVADNVNGLYLHGHMRQCFLSLLVLFVVAVIII